MDTLYNMIIDNLIGKTADLKKYTDELYGYGESLPKYRIFNRSLYVDYIDKNGHKKENILLNRPKSDEKRLNYDSLVRLELHTGLIYLPLQIDELLEENVEAVMYESINNLYNNEFKVVSARLIIKQTEIETLYKEIAHAFEIL